MFIIVVIVVLVAILVITLTGMISTTTADFKPPQHERAGPQVPQALLQHARVRRPRDEGEAFLFVFLRFSCFGFFGFRLVTIEL